MKIIPNNKQTFKKDKNKTLILNIPLNYDDIILLPLKFQIKTEERI